MTLSDSAFAKILNHLHLMTKDGGLDDETLAEALIRAGVVLLAVDRSTPSTTAEPAAYQGTAHAMVDRSVVWCQRMTEDR